MMRKSDREYKVSAMSFYELDRLLYKKVNEANNNLFGGIFPFISRLMDENEKILEELDYIKAYIQNSDKPLVAPVSIEVDATEKVKQPRGTSPEEVYEEPSAEELEAVKRYLDKTEKEQKRFKKKYTPKLRVKELG